MGVADAARTQCLCSSLLPSTCWHFPDLPNFLAVGMTMWLSSGQWHKSRGTVCYTGASPAWSSLSFAVCTWMDWALRKVEPAEGRSLVTWMTAWSNPPTLHDLSHTALCLTGNRPGSKPLKAGLFGTVLSLLWLLQWGLNKPIKAIYSQNIVYFPPNTYLQLSKGNGWER